MIDDIKKYELKNPEQTLRTVQAILRGEQVLEDTAFYMGVSCARREQYKDDAVWEAYYGKYKCGTVACIGGHAWLVENPGDYDGADNYVIEQILSKRLTALYYDFNNEDSKEEAIIAIDRYFDETIPTEEIWNF